MMTIGVDPHMQTHTAVLVGPAGELEAELTVEARAHGHERLLAWARGRAPGRVWAIEDCRHVSGGLERFLLLAGEQVVRVPPKLMAGARNSGREFGESDSIDGLAVAQAALRYRDRLPVAQLAGVERDIALLLDHREGMIAERTRLQNRLRWQLHDLDPDLNVPARKLDLHVVLKSLDKRLGRLEQTPQVRICRDLIHRCGELTKLAAEIEQELGVLVRGHAHPLLGLPGIGVLTAAKLIAEVANVERFSSDRQLAKLAGVAPLDASSGKQHRHRLNRTGNRQLNRALHTIAITQARIHQPARDYIARRVAEGKTKKEALRALKRHLARIIYRLLCDISRRRQAHPRQALEAPLNGLCITRPNLANTGIALT
jgi:transposase